MDLRKHNRFVEIDWSWLVPAARYLTSGRTPTWLLALSVCFAQAGCGGDADAQPAAAGAPRVALVRVGPVVRETVRPETRGVGTVMARRTSVVASGAEGKVDSFLVGVGDIVREGQDLSVLTMVTTDLGIQEAQSILLERKQEYESLLAGRSDELTEAQARMEAAEVTMRIAKDRLTRQEDLAREGAAVRDSLDEARERSQAADKMYEVARAAYEMIVKGTPVEQAKARYDAQQHQVDFLIAERDKRTTHAPFAGVVVAEHTEVGQWLSKNDTVVTIADLLEEVEVVVRVDQRELGNVELGGEVQVSVEGVEDCADTGRVVAIIPRSDWERGARTFPVKVSIPNRVRTVGDRKQPVLHEGMLARVTFSGPPREAVLVPKSCLIRSESGTRLYAVVPGEKPGTGKARPVMVREGGAFGERVEVLGDELQPGMLVVTEGAERLTPFADISIQEDAPAGGPPAGTGAAKDATTTSASETADAGAAGSSAPDKPSSGTTAP